MIRLRKLGWGKPLYTRECTCPQCGIFSGDLKEECLPRIISEFPTVVRLRCWVCHFQWLERKAAAAAAAGGQS